MPKNQINEREQMEILTIEQFVPQDQNIKMTKGLEIDSIFDPFVYGMSTLSQIF